MANGGSIDSVDSLYDDTEEIDLNGYQDGSVMNRPDIGLVAPREELTIQKEMQGKNVFPIAEVTLGVALLVVLLGIWRMRRHGK